MVVTVLALVIVSARPLIFRPLWLFLLFHWFDRPVTVAMLSALVLVAVTVPVLMLLVLLVC